MAGTNFDFEVDEILSNLDLLNDSMNRSVNRILRESAEPLKETIEGNVNRSDGSTHRRGEKHAQDDVVIGRMRMEDRDRDYKFVEVGYETTAWRMWFVEFGTIYQRPQGNIQRSIGEAHGDVRRVQVEKLRELIARGSN